MRGQTPNVIVVDEGLFANHISVVLPMIVDGRVMIMLSSTHGVWGKDNPLVEWAFAARDPDGLPSLRVVFARRCEACAELGLIFCPHVIEVPPWQNDDEAAVGGERDVQMAKPTGPLLSASARARLLDPAAEIGPAVENAPIVIGIDPGGGQCYTAAVALELHENGAAVVGVAASARPGLEDLGDIAQFVSRVAARYCITHRVVVYIENNLGAAAGRLMDDIRRVCAPANMRNVYLLREPGHAVVGLRTRAGRPDFFASTLYHWIEVRRAVQVLPHGRCITLLGGRDGSLVTDATPGGYAAAVQLLLTQLGNVRNENGAIVYKRGGELAGEGRPGDDDLFFAAAMAFMGMVLAAPQYAPVYGAAPEGTPGGTALRGMAVVGPENMAYLYQRRGERVL